MLLDQQVHGNRFNWADVARRLQALPVYGEQKARIFLALLGKQLGIRPEASARLRGTTASRAPAALSRTSQTRLAWPRSTRSSGGARPRSGPRADAGSPTQWVTDSLMQGPEFLDRG
jgi:hypothetical protein